MQNQQDLEDIKKNHTTAEKKTPGRVRKMKLFGGKRYESRKQPSVKQGQQLRPLFV